MKTVSSPVTPSLPTIKEEEQDSSFENKSPMETSMVDKSDERKDDTIETVAHDPKKLGSKRKHEEVSSPAYSEERESSPPKAKARVELEKEISEGFIHESPREQPPLSAAKSTRSSELMNKSIGTFSASSTSSSSQFGEVSHFLCFPVDSKGIADPSQGFYSSRPPKNVKLHGSFKLMSPMASTKLIGLMKDRKNWSERISSDPDGMPLPDTPVSSRFGNGSGAGLATPPVRQVSDLLGHQTPSAYGNASGAAFQTPVAVGSMPDVVPRTPPPNEPDLVAAYLAERRNSNTTPQSASQNRIIYNGDRGRVVPLASVLSNESIDTLSDGTKRVVLAKNGTPMACVGNTMEVLSATPSSVEDQRKWQRWTEAEDEILRDAVEKEGSPHNWKRISKKYFLGVRSDTQCKNRWKKALQPGLIRGSWTRDEDRTILNSVENGMKFGEIARMLPGRIAEQVKERWVNTLDPSLSREAWSDEELQLLFELQNKLGNQWKKIAEKLPGRSENHVKNRWYNAKMQQRRKMKKIAAESEAAERLQRARGEYVAEL